MVICFSVAPAAKTALDELMGSREFKDISEVISMALVNYRVIHGVVKKEGHSLINTEEQAPPGASQPERHGDNPPQSRSSPLPRFVAIPEIFGTCRPDLDRLELISPAEQPLPLSLDIPPKDWLWGQYNRFLPVKATCRALLRLVADSPMGVPLDDAVSRISYAACTLGDVLGDMDSRVQRRREDAISAAFPTTAYDGAQARLRFGNQFVGVIKQGILLGLPAGLKLVGCHPSKVPLLSLTKQGAEFAALENPALDTRDQWVSRTLSDAEIQFLLDHIKRAVPEEASAYVSLIDGIVGGADTPDKLDAYLRQRFELENNDAMKPSFLATQRTGAVSRMVELGLLARERSGLHVTYVVTHPGNCFRSQLSSGVVNGIA